MGFGVIGGAGRRPAVLMVHDYPPVTGGGLAVSVRELSELFAADAEFRTLSSRLIDHFSDDRRRHPPTPALAMLAELRAAEAVVAHWTFSFRRLSTLALLLAPVAGTPTVWVVHTGPDHLVYNRLQHLPPAASRWLVQRLAKAADRRRVPIVALSYSHAASLRVAGVPVTHVLPLPVVPQRAYQTVYDHHLSRRRGPGVLGVIGELSRLKGADALPALVAEATPRYSFRIVGAGPRAPALERAISRLDSRRQACIDLSRRVPPEDMPAVYREIDCVLSLSRTESQSRVVLEAMLCGVLVLARPVDGVVDVVAHGRTGFLVDPDDPASVVGLLDQLAGQPLRVRAVLAAARRTALRHFTVSRAGWQAFFAGLGVGAPTASVTAASAFPGT